MGAKRLLSWGRSNSLGHVRRLNIFIRFGSVTCKPKGLSSKDLYRNYIYSGPKHFDRKRECYRRDCWVYSGNIFHSPMDASSPPRLGKRRTRLKEEEVSPSNTLPLSWGRLNGCFHNSYKRCVSMKSYLSLGMILPVVTVIVTLVASAKEHPGIMGGAVVGAAASALFAVIRSREKRDRPEDFEAEFRARRRVARRKKKTTGR